MSNKLWISRRDNRPCATSFPSHPVDIETTRFQHRFGCENCYCAACPILCKESNTGARVERTSPRPTISTVPYSAGGASRRKSLAAAPQRFPESDHRRPFLRIRSCSASSSSIRVHGTWRRKAPHWEDKLDPAARTSATAPRSTSGSSPSAVKPRLVWELGARRCFRRRPCRSSNIHEGSRRAGYRADEARHGGRPPGPAERRNKPERPVR